MLSAAPHYLYRSTLDRLIAGVKALRLPAPPRGSRHGAADLRGHLDSHLPRCWKLETDLWVRARALPTEAELSAASDADVFKWNDFFCRVLPPSGWGGCARCIHNEDYPDQPFDLKASRSAREASLCALGWPGCLPDKKTLLEHMLVRVEFEYAAHLYSHERGEWCDECHCICAQIAGDSDDESASADGADAQCVGDDCEMDAVDELDDWGYSTDDDDTDEYRFGGPSSLGETAE